MQHCSLCGAPGTSSKSCPLNDEATSYKPRKHAAAVKTIKDGLEGCSNKTRSCKGLKQGISQNQAGGSLFGYLFGPSTSKKDISPQGENPKDYKLRINNSKKSDDRSLYDRLGGSFPISAVVNRFSDQLLTNPLVGADSPNLELSKWSTQDFATRLPGLKFLRTLWVCSKTGGPFDYTGQNLKTAHERFHITPEEFDAVSDELGLALDYFKVPELEKNQVLAAFNAQKEDVTYGSRINDEKAANGYGTSAVRCPFSNPNK